MSEGFEPSADTDKITMNDIKVIFAMIIGFVIGYFVKGMV